MQRFSRDEFEARLAAVPLERPIVIGGAVATHGFEVEFFQHLARDQNFVTDGLDAILAELTGRAKKLRDRLWRLPPKVQDALCEYLSTMEGKPLDQATLDRAMAPHFEDICRRRLSLLSVDTSSVPFIDNSKVITEPALGKKEVISLPTSTLGEIFSQLDQMVEKLGQEADLSFHFTTYVPLSFVRKNPALEPWLRRMGDTIHGWMMEHATRAVALVFKTLARTSAEHDGLANKGSIRAYPVKDGFFRIELRGFRGSVEDLKRQVLILMAALRDPSMVHGFEVERAALAVDNLGAGLMRSQLEAFKGQPLTAHEETRLQEMVPRAEFVPGRHLHPLLGYEHASWLTAEERVQVEQANASFVAGSWELMQRPNLTERERGIAFCDLLLRWSKDAGYHRFMEQSLLLPEQLLPRTPTPLLAQALAGVPLKALSSDALPSIPTEQLEEALQLLQPEERWKIWTQLPAPIAKATAGALTPTTMA